jgi:hypothetical protein
MNEPAVTVALACEHGCDDVLPLWPRGGADWAVVGLDPESQVSPELRREVLDWNDEMVRESMRQQDEDAEEPFAPELHERGRALAARLDAELGPAVRVVYEACDDDFEL